MWDRCGGWNRQSQGPRSRVQPGGEDTKPNRATRRRCNRYILCGIQQVEGDSISKTFSRLQSGMGRLFLITVMSQLVFVNVESYTKYTSAHVRLKTGHARNVKCKYPDMVERRIQKAQQYPRESLTRKKRPCSRGMLAISLSLLILSLECASQLCNVLRILLALCLLVAICFVCLFYGSRIKLLPYTNFKQTSILQYKLLGRIQYMVEVLS